MRYNQLLSDCVCYAKDRHITHQFPIIIQNDPDRFADKDLEICVKFSGDGARFSSSSSFLLLSFSLPGTAPNVLSGAGRSNIPNN